MTDRILSFSGMQPQDALERAVRMIGDAFEKGGRLYLCGNGGSAADCEHMTGELMKSFQIARPLSGQDRRALDALDPSGRLSSSLQGALPAFSLVSQSALITAWNNDADPDCVYAQQIYGYGRTGDVLLGFSTSGNADNVYLAVLAAKAKGVSSILVTGSGGGKTAPVADLAVKLPADTTARIQEYTLPFYHSLCAGLEARFFGEENNGGSRHGSL